MSSVPTVFARPPVTSSTLSFDTTRIHYDLYDSPSRSLVLVIPGFWRDRRHPAMVRLARMVSSMGYRVAVLDMRGHGASGGTYGFNHKEHLDVAAVAGELLSSYPIETVTLLGLSYGGSIAISTAARHELPIASLLLISPVADFGMITPRINLLSLHRHIALSQVLRRPRFVWKVRGAPKLKALDDIGSIKAPSCMIHVKHDWLVGHEHSVALYEKAPEPKELHIIDISGNFHADRIFSAASTEIDPIVSGFLARHTPS